ncbi:hypothetical protein [Mesorhizobium amorphae]|uniref:hypothetical protein n=1 Tax=Mesorhizobium amorphae TaxID=71433 RepID=UPI001AEEA419|nr:hypothetical protein [Mesorhizobium amorphae]
MTNEAGARAVAADMVGKTLIVNEVLRWSDTGFDVASRIHREAARDQHPRRVPKTDKRVPNAQSTE